MAAAFADETVFRTIRMTGLRATQPTDFIVKQLKFAELNR